MFLLRGERSFALDWKSVGVRYQWHEVNGAHAFLRDEGPRYDAALASQCYGLVFELFHGPPGTGNGAGECAKGGRKPGTRIPCEDHAWCLRAP